MENKIRINNNNTSIDSSELFTKHVVQRLKDKLSAQV